MDNDTLLAQIKTLLGQKAKGATSRARRTAINDIKKRFLEAYHFSIKKESPADNLVGELRLQAFTELKTILQTLFSEAKAYARDNNLPEADALVFYTELIFDIGIINEAKAAQEYEEELENSEREVNEN